MHKTVKDILSNFIYVVEHFGFVPNGGRIYYLKRSQPPILIMAFYEYLQATGDVKFILESLPTLEKISFINLISI
jgi:alpha,alpha-trehalase